MATATMLEGEQTDVHDTRTPKAHFRKMSANFQKKGSYLDSLQSQKVINDFKGVSRNCLIAL
jgi:hypothetical protein